MAAPDGPGEDANDPSPSLRSGVAQEGLQGDLGSRNSHAMVHGQGDSLAAQGGTLLVHVGGWTHPHGESARIRSAGPPHDHLAMAGPGGPRSDPPEAIGRAKEKRNRSEAHALRLPEERPVGGPLRRVDPGLDLLPDEPQVRRSKRSRPPISVRLVDSRPSPTVRTFVAVLSSARSRASALGIRTPPSGGEGPELGPDGFEPSINRL